MLSLPLTMNWNFDAFANGDDGESNVVDDIKCR